MNELTEVPVFAYILIAILLISQSLFLFFHSRKHGHLKWFWGIWGCLNAPTPLVVYVLWIKWLQPTLRNRRQQ